ncbi:TolC family protein [Paucibacter sp. AS339]|uniref:TolC family protein n=1 Tax=Paucibacter hankyongi TaxID=3133434 RepID=UPI0030979AA3
MNDAMKTLSTLALAAALTVGLGACALVPQTGATPELATPLSLPSNWQQLQNGGAAAADWAGALDAQLAALQQQALKANRDISLALKRWERGQLQVRGAALDRGPTPSLSAGASGSRAIEQGPVSRSYSLNAGVGFEADLWGRLAHAESAQAAQAESLRSDWAAAQLLIRSRVAESYWSLAALALEQPLIEEQLQGAEAVLALTRLRVREGKLLPIEVDKSASTLQGLHSRLAQLQRERIQHQLTLGLLLDSPAPSLPALPLLPASAPGDWQAGAPAEVLERRPDVQRARAGVDSALAQWRGSEAARYPRLSLNLGIGTGGQQWTDWLERPLATLSANLVVPLVDWRRLELQRAQAGNEVESAALSLRDILHKALVEVEQLAAERRELRAQAIANQARLSEAQQTEKLAALRFEVGAIARADWLQARNARLSAEQEAIQLRLRQWLNQAALHKALASA